MNRFKALLLLAVSVMTGCTATQRLVHVYSDDALPPAIFQYQDGGSSLYYTFVINEGVVPDTFVFFYGGSGCASWKYVMPGYVNGLDAAARIFVLNKRFVGDRDSGLFSCSEEFHRTNSPDQWVADYTEFIKSQLRTAPITPTHVLLVGVSEGALPAVRVANLVPSVTHLAIIGDGAYTMRQALTVLHKKGEIPLDVAEGWERISADPLSIENHWYGHPYLYWSQIMDIDPLDGFLDLDIPIIVGIGETDHSVPIESALFLESQFKAAMKSNLILRIYPGADHRLNAAGKSYRNDFFAEVGHFLR